MIMKGILVIIDGLGDRPCKKLGGKTPLGAASTPNLDYFATHGELGYMYSAGENFVPESDSAVLAILGNKVSPGLRGYFEALGAGIELGRGDLALRTNFATIEDLKSLNVIDRRAGRTLTTQEATLLANSLNKELKLPCKFLFKNTVQHRGVLILRGGFSDNITNTDPEYHSKGEIKLKDKLNYSQPLDEEDNTKYTANIINSFIEQGYKVLNEHPVNQKRRIKGLFPANLILTRDASSSIPSIKQFKKWASIVNMPLEIGISQASSMKLFSTPYPELTAHDVYKNLFEALNSICKFAVKIINSQKDKFDYFYVHFKETDVPGHDNLPEQKKLMIELLDKEFFSFLKDFSKKNKIQVLVTADHSTPCELKNHSADHVPVLLCNWRGKTQKHFSESESKQGSLGKILGVDLLKKVGFVK